MDTATHSFLTDILHAFAQALLTPDIILLLALVAYALFSIGSILVEFFTERRNFKIAMPKFLAALMGANENDIPRVITESGLLNRQKTALLTVFDYRTLPGDALLALIRRTVNTEETRYDKITGRNNTAAKISPMLGLMGTLIPLGPGIEALGRADTAALSSSLLIAFDTTVTGLIVAAICLAIAKIRNNWYNDYLSALDSSMATMLQKIEDLRTQGNISTETPTDYAFIFEKGLKEGMKDAPKHGATESLQQKEEVDSSTHQSMPKFTFSPVATSTPSFNTPSVPSTTTTPITSPNTAPTTPPNTAPITPPNTAPITPPNTTLVSSPNTTPVSSPNTTPVSSPNTTPVSSPNTTPVSSPNTTRVPSPEAIRFKPYTPSGQSDNLNETRN